jgi:hypothetical protein
MGQTNPRPERLYLLFEERDGLRQEILRLQDHSYKATLGFVSSGVATIAAAYFGEQNVSDPTLRFVGLLALSQIVYVAYLVVVSININLQIHSSYVKALDITISDILSEPVLLWERQVTERYLNQPLNALFLCLLTSNLMLAAFFGACVYIVAARLGWWFLVLGGVEVAVVGALLLAANWERTNAKKEFVARLRGETPEVPRHWLDALLTWLSSRRGSP